MFRDIDRKKIRRRWWLRNIFWMILLTATGLTAYYLFVPFIHQVQTMEAEKQAVQQEGNSFEMVGKEAHEHFVENRLDWFKPGVMANQFKKVSDISQVPLQGGWFNTTPLDFNSLRETDHFILLYFWSTSSVASLNTNRYIEWLWKNYKDSGLVVVGIHSPQFKSEKNKAAIWQAVQAEGLTFPILLDGEKKLWDKLRVYDAPTQYLLNPAGNVIYSYIGENNFQEETDILRQHLTAQGWLVNAPKQVPNFSDYTGNYTTADLYTGFNKKRRVFGNDTQGSRNKITSFSLPEQIEQNKIYLNGDWLVKPEYIESKSNAAVIINFLGSQAYAYMKATEAQPLNTVVTLDGGVVPAQQQKQILVTDRGGLYRLTDNTLQYGAHELIINVPKGVELYVVRFR